MSAWLSAGGLSSARRGHVAPRILRAVGVWCHGGMGSPLGPRCRQIYEGFSATPARSPCNLTHHPGARCQPMVGLNNHGGMGSPFSWHCRHQDSETESSRVLFHLFCVCVLCPLKGFLMNFELFFFHQTTRSTLQCISNPLAAFL